MVCRGSAGRQIDFGKGNFHVRVTGPGRRKPTAARLRSAALLAIATLLAAPLQAQTASQITPREFTPELQRLRGSVVFTGQPGTQAPPGSEAIGITLSGVDLQNPLPQMAGANRAYVDRLTRGRIPVSELFEATAALEAAYADAGYVLARVVLPQQSLRDGGRLRVVVVNGFVETVDTSNVDPNIRRRIDQLTASLVNRPGLTREELERQLLLAGDIPGTALRSAIAAGEAQGATVIGVDPEYRLITGFVGFGNPSSTELGEFNLNTGIEINSPFKLGETLYARLSGAPEKLFSEDPRSRVFALGAAVPVGISGASVNVEATFSDTMPDDAAAPTRSDFDRQSFRFFYPWKRGRILNVTGQAMLDLQQEEQALIGGGTIFRDQLTILRAGANMSLLLPDRSFTQAALVLSRGIDAFGARTAAEAAGGPPLSRAGADATFTKLVGSASHQRDLSERIALSVTGRFQTSFGRPLVNSEQFGLVGGSELSSFDNGALRGDSGAVVRAELSTRFDSTISELPVSFSPYVFAGYGVAKLENPTALEQSITKAASYGIGLDVASSMNSSFRSGSMRIEYGIGTRDDATPDEKRFSISGTFRF